jgi:hypothetical protein
MSGNKWTHGAQAFAAVTTALVGAIGLGVALWHGARHEDKPAPAVAASTTAAPVRTEAPRRPAAQPVTVEPVSASLAFTGPADSDGNRPVQAILTLRIRNDGAAPFHVAWLDARRDTAFDLDSGTRLAGSRDTSASGFPNCTHEKARDCRESEMVLLVPTDAQLGTLTLSGTVGADAAKRLAGATRATFTSRLAIRPAQGEPYARAVSLERVPVSNAAR